MGDDGHGHNTGGSTGHGHGHGHGVSARTDGRWLSIALALIVTFMLGEVVVGVIAHSLALISDAAHMLTDAASIVLALVAMRLAARPARGSYTYGLKRTEILSAQANGLTLLLLSVWCRRTARTATGLSTAMNPTPTSSPGAHSNPGPVVAVYRRYPAPT